MLNRFFVFCWWIWFLTILYAFNLFPFSLLYLSIISFIFTCFFFIFNLKIYYLKRVLIFFIELIFIIINYHYHVNRDKKSLLDINILFKNILIFLIYLIVLKMNNKTFYTVYFIDIKKEHYNI